METTGFHLFSSHIARDTSLSVYRKFAVLNTRNILYLQSELADLEVQLQELDAEGNREEVDSDIWAISRSWRKMRDAGVSFQESKPAVANTQESQDPRNSWSVMLKITRVLKEYNEALQAQAWLQSLEKPPTHMHKIMRAALEWDTNLRSNISEEDLEYLDSKNFQDTISLTPDPNREASSRFLANKLGWLFFSWEEKQGLPQKGYTMSSDHRLRRITRVVAVVLSSILPVLSIVILYHVQSDIHIGLTIVLSTLFFAVVALLTDARNVEVMAATAAYAAVLVVFVSGKLQSP